MREIVETNILDVLPDGTITRLELKTDSINMTIGREEPDQHFTIEKVDVVNHAHMEEALNDLAAQLHEYRIYSIDICCVDESKTTLRL